MPRLKIHFILLFVWLSAIFAPPVVSLLSAGSKSLVTINLNEEKEQEQGKKDIDEKLIVEKKGADFSLLSLLQGSLSHDFYILDNSEHFSEIILPPPEPLI